MKHDMASRVYENDGNTAVVDLVDVAALRVLDVGCGMGATASRLLRRNPARSIYGITISPAEAALASRHTARCWVADIEADAPLEACEGTYDALIFSHVLEHMRDPARTLQRFMSCLRPGGICVIAVPNVMVWMQRMQFLSGHFEYQHDGLMDETHLRFFSYRTAARYLLARAPELEVVSQHVTGVVPLWLARRHLLSARIAERVDAWGCRRFPNFFGAEILLKAVKRT